LKPFLKMHRIWGLGPIEVRFTTAKNIQIVQSHKMFNILSLSIEGWHKTKAPNVAEADPKDMIFFEFGYAIAKGEIMRESISLYKVMNRCRRCMKNGVAA